jgi:hypothetical protein
MTKILRAGIEVVSGRGYRIKWKREDDVQNYEISIDNINFYNEKEEEYVYCDITSSIITFAATLMEDSDNEYEITFFGLINFSLEKEDERAFSKSGFIVDYALTFSIDGSEIEADDGYEFIENTSTQLYDVLTISG